MAKIYKTAPPCKKDCPKRSVGCHGSCKDYIQWKNEAAEAPLRIYYKTSVEKKHPKSW